MVAGLARCAEADVPAPPTGTVVVSVDDSRVELTSRLSLGVTHTHLGLEQPGAKPAAVERASALLKGTISYQNTHIMGWGVNNPSPRPGVYDFASLDRRIRWMRSIGAPIVITLCTAPGWMKRGGDDWAMEKRILPEHHDDFARLCVEVAKRYPDVRYYQVWNEFKGYWNGWEGHPDNWDAADYTNLYNKVYDALKAHDPALQVGGFYVVVKGSGGSTLGRKGAHAQVPLVASDREVLDYWLKHKRGADFVCLDRSIKGSHDKNTYSPDELMSLTPLFGKVTREVAELSHLPVWWSEIYATKENEDPDRTAAAYASAYVHALRGGASVALLWNPNEGETNGYLFSDVRGADGGTPSPHYKAYHAIATRFPAGTEIVAASSTSPWVEVLASKAHTLLVNKWSGPVTVCVQGRTVGLKAFEVAVIAGSGSRVERTGK
jgi:hypothetical protein